MASFEPDDRFDPHGPPPRPMTPPVRRGFLVVLAVLTVSAVLVYGIPYVAERTGYAWEAGRSRAASEALAKLDDAQIIDRSSLLFRLAITKVAPAVVNIRSYRQVAAGGPNGAAVPPGADALGRNLIESSSGSGVVINHKDRGAFVVTNNHVVQGADELVVRLSRGAQYPAKLVGTDPKTDLAVLQVNAPVKVAAEWGDADKVDVGDWVLAIGSPFMLDQTVTAGIVSATRRNNIPLGEAEQYQDFIQTDAAVNPGNSGGPLIDLRGRVVGINTAIFSPPGVGGDDAPRGNIGIGLAISATMARRVVDDLIEHGRVSRGYLGVEFRELAGEEAERLGLKEPRGVVVRGVEPGGPAAKGGVKPGDVIVKIGDEPIEGGLDLRNRIATFRPGHDVALGVVRDGKPDAVTVTVGEWPVLASYGLRLADLGPDLAGRFPGKPRRAVAVAGVQPHSEAARARLLPGMRLLRVGDREVATVAEAEAAAAKLDPSQGVPLTVQILDGRSAEVALGRPGRP